MSANDEADSSEDDEDDRDGGLEYEEDDADRMGEVREKRTEELEAPEDEVDGLFDVEINALDEGCGMIHNKYIDKFKPMMDEITR
jgi:hypothetical protein